MKDEQYEFFSEKEFTVFEFISIGSKGNIIKTVQYLQTEIDDVYNLAFGDKNVSTGEFDDSVITNNGDSEKVPMTIAYTVYAFTNEYPDAIIYATGSSKSRTRLYQIGIAKFLTDITMDFDLYGEVNNEWKSFVKGMNYDAFLKNENDYFRVMKKSLIDKHPEVKIDESLKKYNGIVLFPEKLVKANETLKKIGLPKELQKANKIKGASEESLEAIK